MFQLIVRDKMLRLLSTTMTALVLLGTAQAQESAKPELVIQNGHRSYIYSVTFSPDGKLMASGSEDRTLKLWEVSTGRPLRSFTGHDKKIASVAFSPDGMMLASGSEDHRIKLWEVSSGRLVRTFSKHSGEICSVSFSPDGKLLVSGSDDKTAKLWEVSSGRLVRSFDGEGYLGNCIAFSPDGKMLAWGGNKVLNLWDVNSGQLVRSFEGGRLIAFSPDGKTLATCSTDNNNSIRLWDVNTGRLIRSFEGHNVSGYCLVFSPNGKLLVSSNSDNKLLLWDVNTGQLNRSIEGYSYSILSVAFNPDGKMLASTSYEETIKLWDVSTARLIRSYGGRFVSVPSVAFSPDGKTLASGSEDKTFKLWDTSSGRLIRSFEGHSDSVNSVVFSSDGKLLASGSRDSTIKLWDASNGRLIRSFMRYRVPVNSVTINPDGKLLASGSNDKNTVLLWDLNSDLPIRSFEGEGGSISPIVFSQDGKMLASASADKTVKLWEVNSGRLIRSFEGHGSYITSVAISPDGKILASGDGDDMLNLWDVSSGRPIHSFKGQSSFGGTKYVAFSLDGKMLASGSSNGTIKLWDVNSGQLIRSFIGHGVSVNSVAFSPDGKRLASGGDDERMKIWSVETGVLLASFIHFNDGNWIVYTPDNYYVSSEDAAKHIYWRVGDQDYGEAKFKARLNQPGIIAARLNFQGVATSATSGGIENSRPNATNSNSVVSQPAKPPAKDSTAPKIVITSPPVARGVGVKSIASRIMVTGQALDDSGVSEVVVRGVPARLDAQDNFSVEVLLKIGDNQITVTATDIYGNQATENFSIQRDPEPVTVTGPPPIAPAGKYVALVIGNNAHRHLPLLQTAINDAEQVAKALSDNYGFETRVLRNAERDQIIAAFNEYRKTLADEDHLLIFYAGHGIFDRDVTKAYWLPADASKTDNAKWISADDITTNIRGIRARQILIISDSCYSGTIARDAAYRLTTPAERDRYIEKMLQGTSRMLMTSGGNEPVSDGGGGGHSVFAGTLLRGLRQMDRSIFTAEELFYGFIRESVAGKSDQTPEYNPLRNSGHEAGDFVFVRRQQ